MQEAKGNVTEEAISAALYPEKDGSYVRAKARLEALKRSYDFSQKRVVDLGCGRGYFALQLASLAESVLAIDGDCEKIEEAQALAKRTGISNVQFECAVITPDYLSKLDHHDVALFLAVIHHIINEGGPYVWNEGVAGVEKGRELLSALSARTQALMFEMGNVPQMDKDPEVWIPEVLLEPAGFQSITVIPPPAFEGPMGLVRRVMHHTLPGWLKAGSSQLSNSVQRATGYDLRDHRHLFLARKEVGATG